MSKPSRDELVAFAMLVIIAAVLVAGACLYARWSYGDWHCGLPGVHCRRVVKP